MNTLASFSFFIFLLPLLYRSLLIPFPHSGQNNHHGSQTAYGGDYEAQRHWMELTLHLPLSQWYTYDTSYWGLDYPPLIAYGSQIMGWLSSTLVGEESVALDDSRGYEDDVHKVFMRGTVMMWDLVAYFPFAYLLSRRLTNCDAKENQNSNVKTMLLWLTVVSQPALVLIDNGHFQYNSVCLGFSLGAFHFMTLCCDKISGGKGIGGGIGIHDVIASVLFCLALNWKQMGLYYAPAVFSFLLGKCFRSTRTCTRTNKNQNASQHVPANAVRAVDVAKNISILGSAVIGTFSVLWYPFYHYRQDSNESWMGVYGPILRRIFPFSRGLFEGKVANLWCVAAIKPFSIRERIAEDVQPLCALLLTFGMVLPFCTCLFFIGRSCPTISTSTTTSSSSSSSSSSMTMQSKLLKGILWGATGTSLSFFLASFQVHEKSILLPLAPLSLLLMDQPLLVMWFSLISTWSLWHLLVTDRLQVVYFVSLMIFICIYYYVGPFLQTSNGCENTMKTKVNTTRSATIMSSFHILFTKLIVPSSLTAMVLLHILEAIVVPPPNLPDIFPVLWVIVGCGSFLITWLAALLNLVQLTFSDVNPVSIKED